MLPRHAPFNERFAPLRRGGVETLAEVMAQGFR